MLGPAPLVLSRIAIVMMTETKAMDARFMQIPLGLKNHFAPARGACDLNKETQQQVDQRTGTSGKINRESSCDRCSVCPPAIAHDSAVRRKKGFSRRVGDGTNRGRSDPADAFGEW